MKDLNSELTSLQQKQGHMEETMITKQKNLDRVGSKLQIHRQRNAEEKVRYFDNFVTLTTRHTKHPKISHNYNKFEKYGGKMVLSNHKYILVVISYLIQSHSPSDCLSP